MEKASVADSKGSVVEICTKYAQKGMSRSSSPSSSLRWRSRLVEPFLFIGYLFLVGDLGAIRN